MTASERPAQTGRRGHPPLAAILVILLALIGYLFYRSFTGRPNPNLILASGSIEADETVVSPKIAGKLSGLYVDEGSEVKKGDLLAELDQSELGAQLDQSRAALASTQAKLDAAVKGNRPEQIAQAQAQYDAALSTQAGAKLSVSVARDNLRKVTDLKGAVDAAVSRLATSVAAYQQANAALNLVRAGPRPDQVQAARAALDQAKVQRTKTQADYDRNAMLAQEGAISAQQFDSYRAARDSAVKAVAQAQAQVDDLLAGARPQEVREAEMAVSQAKANLEGAEDALRNAKESYQDRLAAKSQFDSAQSGANVAANQVQAAKAALDLVLAGTREEDLASIRATRDQAFKAVAYAADLVRDCKLFAPSDGVVKTKSALPGESLSPGSPVLTLADLDHIWIRVYVPEDQYGKLQLGQPVEIRVDSFPDVTFQGRILSIASSAEFTPKNAQTPEERVKLVFAVKIQVDNPGRRLKPGMPGDATILVRP